jgi:aspartate ammonia-lyase
MSKAHSSQNKPELWGMETQKALENFGRGHCPSTLIRALAETKLAVIQAQQTELKKFSPGQFTTINAALEQIIAGQHDQAFPLSLRQGGAGTSLHMNLLEVTANLAMILDPSQRIDPLEDLNQGQSTNDVLPTAITIMALRELNRVEKRVTELQECFTDLEQRFQGALMVGRTQLQDALPMTLGQLFGSYAGAVARDRWRLHKVRERFRTIPLGGGAIGTSHHIPQKVIFQAEKNLREITGLPLSRSQNLMDEISHADKYAELSGVYQRLAETLVKISSDLIYYASSPVAEIPHPNQQYGSSLMPFKTNPVILEFVKGQALHVQGEALKISLYTQSAQLQLNPWLIFLAESLLSQSHSLVLALDQWMSRYLDQLTPSISSMESNVWGSQALFNALRAHLPYQQLKEAYNTGKGQGSLDKLQVALGVDEETWARWFSPGELVRGTPSPNPGLDTKDKEDDRP